MIIRKSTTADAPHILSVIDSAKLSLKTAGIPQWQDGYPDSAGILNDINQGVSYVATDKGRVVATMVVQTIPEPTYASIYQGSWLTAAQSYATVHRLAVDQGNKRAGLGRLLFNYVQQLCQQASIKSIRVDTHKANTPMCTLLQSCGYTNCGTVYMGDGAPRVAYEKII